MTNDDDPVLSASGGMYAAGGMAVLGVGEIDPRLGGVPRLYYAGPEIEVEPPPAVFEPYALIVRTTDPSEAALDLSVVDRATFGHMSVLYEAAARQREIDPEFPWPDASEVCAVIPEDMIATTMVRLPRGFAKDVRTAYPGWSFEVILFV